MQCLQQQQQHGNVCMQLFVGRVAMLGFAAELIGEELTGVSSITIELLYKGHPTCMLGSHSVPEAAIANFAIIERKGNL